MQIKENINLGLKKQNFSDRNTRGTNLEEKTSVGSEGPRRNQHHRGEETRGRPWESQRAVSMRWADGQL